MRSTCNALLLSLGAALLSGCYGTYTGIASLASASGASGMVTFPELQTSVATALSGLGFEPDARCRGEVACFVHKPHTGGPSVLALSGNDAPVSVTIGAHPLLITIRDLRNRSETPFVRITTERIADRLRQDFGITGLRFERQLDLLA